MSSSVPLPVSGPTNGGKTMIAEITTAYCNNPPKLAEGQKKVVTFCSVVPHFILETRANSQTFAIKFTDEHGRQRQVRIGRYGTVTVAQAKRRAMELNAERALGRDPAKERDERRAQVKVKDYIDDRFTPQHANRKSAKTIAVYMRRLSKALGSKTLEEVTPADVAAFQKKLLAEGLAEATVNRHVAYVRALFNLAIEEGVLTGRNPAASLKLFQEVHRDVYLTPDQVRRLVDMLHDEPNRGAAAVMFLLLLTGARLSEILKARHCDVNLALSLVTVPKSKNGRTRYIRLNPPAVQVIRVQQRNAVEGNPYLFPGKKARQPLESVRGPWERARSRANLPAGFRLHDLRHTFASALANAGVPINEIADLLGHRQLSTTKRYAHLAPQRLIETASIAATAWGMLPAPASSS